MKKILRLLILVSVLAALVSCGGIPAGTDETAPLPESAIGTEGAETGDDAPITVRVADRSVRERLAALPIANENMTEDELRQLCVDFCVLQASFQWTPSCTFIYNSAKKSHEFRKNVLYGGLPYTQASSNLYSFLDYYDDETGVFDASSFNGGSLGEILGNDCADAVFWGWARVSNTISYTVTLNMTKANGCLKIGDYVLNEKAIDYSTQYTRSICQDNGREVMYASYALMKTADGMVTWNTEGHARMVVENHPVAEGTSFNGDESYAVFVEQYSKIDPTWQGTREDGAMVQVVGGVNNRYSYANLFASGYLPVTVAELCGADPVEKAEATLDPAPEGEVTLDALLKTTLHVNYRLSNVEFSILDEAGSEVYAGHRYATDKKMYKISLNDVIKKKAIDVATENGRTYTFVITALVGNGETLGVFNGKVRM